MAERNERLNPINVLDMVYRGYLPKDAALLTAMGRNKDLFGRPPIPLDDIPPKDTKFQPPITRGGGLSGGGGATETFISSLFSNMPNDSRAEDNPNDDDLDEEEINATTYVVKPGDSLSKIAKKLYGDTRQYVTLWEANKSTIGDNPNLIRPGQRLVLPKGVYDGNV